MDDEGIVDTVDFSEFETLFQRKSTQKKTSKDAQQSKYQFNET